MSNLIVLDNDVRKKESRALLDYVDNSTANIIFLPYDICFKDWTENEYEAIEYKQWLAYMEDTLGGVEKMYDFWHSKSQSEAREFVDKFINAYNMIADRFGYDYMMEIPE